MEKVKANLVDVFHRSITPSEVTIEDSRIVAIKTVDETLEHYIIPGFIDAHVHIESSMLTPRNFGRLTITNGTIAIVTDPHEIANVKGVEAVEFMIKNSKRSPIKTFFTIPSCVPATPFDVSGDVITAEDVNHLVATKKFVGLSEMMNVPGVLYHDSEVIAKIKAARESGLVIDGHAPLLSGKDLDTYVEEGISTDHECFTLEDAQEKITKGMKILIREGSAARNYDALKSLIASDPEKVMFCTDDAHPDDILERGHIDKLVRKAVAEGYDLFNVLMIASHNAIQHYKLPVGELRIGDLADFLVVDNLKDFRVISTFINGVKKFDKHEDANEEADSIAYLNNFNHEPIYKEQLIKAVESDITVIDLIPNELITNPYTYKIDSPINNLESDSSNDILKIVYINRYNNGLPQVAYCRGFGLKKGAFASSVAHDSHNILAVGTNDEDLTKAINAIIKHQGGLSLSYADLTQILPLPIGGIMTDQPAGKVAKQYNAMEELLSSWGCALKAPYMTLAFLSLVVIPEIKIGEKGLFRYSRFAFDA